MLLFHITFMEKNNRLFPETLIQLFFWGAIDHDHTLKLGIWIGIAAALVQFQTDTFLMDLLKKYALF